MPAGGKRRPRSIRDITHLYLSGVAPPEGRSPGTAHPVTVLVTSPRPLPTRPVHLSNLTLALADVVAPLTCLDLDPYLPNLAYFLGLSPGAVFPPRRGSRPGSSVPIRTPVTRRFDLLCAPDAPGLRAWARHGGRGGCHLVNLPDLATWRSDAELGERVCALVEVLEPDALLLLERGTGDGVPSSPVPPLPLESPVTLLLPIGSGPGAPLPRRLASRGSIIRLEPIEDLAPAPPGLPVLRGDSRGKRATAYRGLASQLLALVASDSARGGRSGRFLREARR